MAWSLHGLDKRLTEPILHIAWQTICFGGNSMSDKTHYYEVRKNGSWTFGFLKASTDSEAIERLAQDEVGFLQRLDNEVTLIDKGETEWATRDSEDKDVSN